MKKIGSGWQVNVFYCGNNTVYKKIKTPFQSAIKILRDMPLMIFRPKTLISWATGMKATHLRSLEFIKDKTSVWKDVGCPVIETNGNYYQKYATPLREVLKKATHEESKKIIDEAIDVCYRLYKEEGFIDKSFNILINFGVSEGKVILTDIGELFSGQEMEDQIKKRPWVKPYVLRFLLMKHRDYFIRRMDELFLNEVLEKGNLI
jgi:hypothetical protein